MDFEFSDEQNALREMARDLFTRAWPVTRLREAWEGKPRDRAVWTALGETGVLGLTVPEALGGGGGNLVDLVPLLEEAGWSAVAEPLVEHLAVAAPALAAAGHEDLLVRMASGGALVSAGSNRNWLIPDADLAELAVVDWDDELHALDPGAVGNPLKTEDRSRRLFVLAAEASADSRFPDAKPAAETARRNGAVGTAAVLNGVSLRLLEESVEHVKGRHQFGRPVGSFQAVKHKLATVYTEVEAARAAVKYGAYAVARSLPDAGVAASVAKIAANEAHAVANREALQVHGGIGFTWEHDLHLWLKRGLALQGAWGTSADHRARLAPIAFGEEER